MEGEKKERRKKGREEKKWLARRRVGWNRVDEGNEGREEGGKS